MENILIKIINQVKLDNVEKKKKYPNLTEDYNMGRLIRPYSPPIKVRSQLDDFFLIAECKKFSPSKGLIRNNFLPLKIAEDYLNGGAKAISVLVEEYFFLGNESYLIQIREKVNVPILWKDFVIDLHQVYRSYIFGADLVLLIFRILDKSTFLKLLSAVIELGMTPLIEVFNLDEIKIVAKLLCDKLNILSKIIIGVNNRDLSTFTVNLNNSIKVKQYLDREGFNLPLISESGISTFKEINFLQQNGFIGALVGESLLRKNDIVKATKILLKG